MLARLDVPLSDLTEEWESVKEERGRAFARKKGAQALERQDEERVRAIMKMRREDRTERQQAEYVSRTRTERKSRRQGSVPAASKPSHRRQVEGVTREFVQTKTGKGLRAAARRRATRLGELRVVNPRMDQPGTSAEVARPKKAVQDTLGPVFRDIIHARKLGKFHDHAFVDILDWLTEYAPVGSVKVKEIKRTRVVLTEAGRMVDPDTAWAKRTFSHCAGWPGNGYLRGVAMFFIVFFLFMLSVTTFVAVDRTREVIKAVAPVLRAGHGSFRLFREGYRKVMTDCVRAASLLSTDAFLGWVGVDPATPLWNGCHGPLLGLAFGLMLAMLLLMAGIESNPGPKCFACGEEGHVKRDCPSGKKAGGPRTAIKVHCDNCQADYYPNERAGRDGHGRQGDAADHGLRRALRAGRWDIPGEKPCNCSLAHYDLYVATRAAARSVNSTVAKEIDTRDSDVDLCQRLYELWTIAPLPPVEQEAAKRVLIEHKFLDPGVDDFAAALACKGKDRVVDAAPASTSPSSPEEAAEGEQHPGVSRVSECPSGSQDGASDGAGTSASAAVKAPHAGPAKAGEARRPLLSGRGSPVAGPPGDGAGAPPVVVAPPVPERPALDGYRIPEFEPFQLPSGEEYREKIEDFMTYLGVEGGTVSQEFARQEYRTEQRLISHRNVTEIKQDFIIGSIVVTDRSDFVVGRAAWLSWLLTVLMVAGFFLATVFCAWGFPAEQVVQSDFCQLEWLTVPVYAESVGPALKYVTLVLGAMNLAWSAYSLFAWLTVTNVPDFHLQYCPHLVSYLVAEYSRYADAASVSSSIRSKIMRAACFPLPDTMALELISGTEKVAEWAVQYQLFFD